MTKIKKLITGLTILADYSNEVDCSNRTIIAGPITIQKISQKHREELRLLDWDFESGNGWEFLI